MSRAKGWKACKWCDHLNVVRIYAEGEGGRFGESPKTDIYGASVSAEAIRGVITNAGYPSLYLPSTKQVLDADRGRLPTVKLQFCEA